MPPRSGSAELDLPGVPALDFRSQPKARPAATEIKDWARHVWVAVHVLTHRVAVGKAENPGDVVCVDEVVEEYAPSH